MNDSFQLSKAKAFQPIRAVIENDEAPPDRSATCSP